ncbi:uncharacterized protein LOC553673 precursor [Danio rerio]|uniref:Uncharacterized protein LOC553673 precursor n=1 Tax=Danio rerio TaxID=7955 RepID=Q502L4_DANRE|nr:uncharacterized protein LOC553673 precursor [Danio rerio]AAH95652.1 Zgc:112038 [Danio rerio]AAI64334.1 Zgc:112038 protein [Danio rerio]|eukprot:NP_001018482.1 uncharacterized protein LOC553673 precursor [Danio rerio]
MKVRQFVYVGEFLLLNIAGALCQLDVCGQAPLNNNNGGDDAVAGSWPWQASIHRISPEDHICGGSLINKDWVLSAAHCFMITATANIKIFLGRQFQTGSNPNEISRTLTQIVIHPDYSTTTQNNDIALLRLSSSVTFTDYIRPVCLASADSVFAGGTKSWITGWDKHRSSDIQVTNVLQEVQLPVVSNTECNADYKGIITDNMICAGINEGGKDACQGDSGGPMVSQNGSRWIQSGIVSFGRECGLPRYPGIYTRVSQYQSWITSELRTNLPGFVSFTSTETRSSSPSLLSFYFSLTSSLLPLILSFYLFF